METPIMNALGAALDRAEEEGIGVVADLAWNNVKKGKSLEACTRGG